MKELSEIYSEMLQTFTQKTGFAMDDTADLAVRLYAAAAQLQSLHFYADWALGQSFVQTATGEYLDRHAALRAITRKNGTKANGILRFAVQTALEAALEIPAGVVCTTSGQVRFVTTEPCTIAAGSLYADAPATAEAAGVSGNVPANSVTLMTEAPVGVAGVTNPAAFSGGTGEEDDETLRARVLDSFKRLPNGANAAFYEARALSHEGVSAVTVIPRENGIGTVTVVIASQSGSEDAALLQRVQDDLQSVREIAVDVTVEYPAVRTVNVSTSITPKQGVSFPQAQAAVQTAIQGFFTGKLLGKNVYKAALGNVIFGTGLVENYRLTAPQSDVFCNEKTLPRLGTLNVTEAAT